MRLWHIDLLPYIPNSQLLSQKREVDLIWKDIAEGKETNHILINYIWEYENPQAELFVYYLALYREFTNRHFVFNTSKHCDIKIVVGDMDRKPFHLHHNLEYMKVCYYNLKEKYIRGQKDFTKQCFKKLYDYMCRIGVEKNEDYKSTL